MIGLLLCTVLQCVAIAYGNDELPADVSVIEGDILVDNKVLEHGRFARQAEPTRAWGQTPIPIAFSSTYPEKQKASAIAGMKYWEKYTCVRFQLGNTSAKDRVEIINGGSCQSFVGKQGGRQTVILGPACNGVSSSGHELGHAIGLQHMQTRSDRDQYVYIDRSNVNPGTFDLNFKVEATAQTMDVPYDYTSIMHYQPYDFAMNPQKPVLIPKDSEYAQCMGNYVPSFYDILRVNRMYKCDAKCASYNTVCRNNGVKDVNNCNQCLCPAGYGGRDCSTNVEGAQVVSATTATQKYSTTIGNTADDQLPEFTYKHLVINAPDGYVVELTIDYMWAGYIAGCKFGGIEVFTKDDTRITPPRVCDMTHKKSYYRSVGKRMYVRMYNRFSQLTAQLSYRAVRA